ncbi:Aldehyde dehydrogenase family protein [Puniceibacterium sediminis]|uniref:Aldehyde dehydrogenase family protein n=1 Tax=Puniceibacterium sediminis TaxID=1608407 RepID=A0A238XFN7_9RHOB|nr:Aldehyde dehydrogenase family protein [Puniceibacterium sediminis]
MPGDARVMQEEPFGPIAPITGFLSYDEVMTRAAALPFGRAGYVFSNSLSVAARATEDLEVGVVGATKCCLPQQRRRSAASSKAVWAGKLVQLACTTTLNRSISR